MSNMEPISERLFAKIRGRFPSVTIGDMNGAVTDNPKLARYFDFDYMEGNNVLGKVSVTLDEKEVVVLYNTNIMAEADEAEKNNWYDFLKEIRFFAKKNMLNFDTRDITKSNLDKRDYAHLTKVAGEKEMQTESVMYGTARTSYEDCDKARLVLKHTKPINQETPGGRTQHVEAIYIESDNGERFKYPFRHLNGARALARHVSNGGNLYDDFGQHIVGLSEELNKLRKFRTYMNRSAVMAESLKGYLDIVAERVEQIKKEVHSLQRQNYYTEASKDFKPAVKEEVPEDLQNAWIDELTIRTFNEELKSVFPYIYNLVQEKNKIEEMGPEAFAEYDGPDETQDGPSSMGMNKYGLSAVNKGGKFISYKDGKMTGEFDSLEDLAKHQEELIKDESITPEAEYEYALNQIVGEEDLLSGDQEALQKLNKLMKSHFAAGVNGNNGISSLKGIIDDPELLMQIKKAGQEDADVCIRPMIMDYVEKKAPEMVSKIDTGDMEEVSTDESGIMYKAGVKKYGKEGMTKIQSAAGQGKSAEEIGAIKDKYNKKKDEGSDDYQAKKKAIQDIQADPNTSKDPELKKELIRRKAELEKKKESHEKTPGEKLEELVKSHYDYTTNAFPKGEQAVITACEKEFGDKSVPYAEKMIGRLLGGKDPEMERIKKLSGL